MVHANIMQAKRNYRESLPSHAKERYERKLKLVGLQECPYALADDMWTVDVTKWPSVEFPDIVLYLVDYLTTDKVVPTDSGVVCSFPIFPGHCFPSPTTLASGFVGRKR